MPWTSWIGIALLLWAAWDLWTGRVWLHRLYLRSQEPMAYWTLLLTWLAVAISCFYW